MGIPLDRIRLRDLMDRLDRFLARPLVRVVLFAAVFLWVWLFLASGAASESRRHPALQQAEPTSCLPGAVSWERHR